jgi:hypothetical protein
MRSSSHRYDFSGLSVSSTIPLPELRPSNAAARCHILVDTRVDPPGNVAWFHEWRKPRGPGWLAFGRIDGGYVLRFPALSDFVVNAAATRITALPAAGLPVATLRHLLIDQVLPLVASRHGHVALHASAVHLDGIGAIGFVGETGRGKSTLAAALAAVGAHIVTDDCLAIEARGPSLYAIPSYPGLRLWPRSPARAGLASSRARQVAHYSRKQRVLSGAVFHRSPAPLRALFLLSPRAGSGVAASMSRVGPRARLMGLLRHGYVLDVEDRRDLGTLFAGLSRIAAAVPVMRLRVRSGSRFLPHAASLIRQFAAGA